VQGVDAERLLLLVAGVVAAASPGAGPHAGPDVAPGHRGLASAKFFDHSSPRVHRLPMPTNGAATRPPYLTGDHRLAAALERTSWR
jgi:hypothetical protein